MATREWIEWFWGDNTNELAKVGCRNVSVRAEPREGQKTVDGIRGGGFGYRIEGDHEEGWKHRFARP